MKDYNEELISMIIDYTGMISESESLKKAFDRGIEFHKHNVRYVLNEHYHATKEHTPIDGNYLDLFKKMELQ